MGVYPGALEQDVASHVLPLAMRKRFSIDAIPSTDAARLTIERALAWESNHRHGHLEDIAADFFRLSAHSLVDDGEVVWELCPRIGGGIALVFVQPASLKHGRRRSLQMAGKGSVVSIPNERLIRVRCEESIAFNRVQRMLGGPGFRMPLVASLMDGKIEVNEVLAYEKLALAQVSSLCGWHGATFFADDISEMYYAVRQIRFFRVAARLRDAITAGINAALMRADCGARILFKGLPDVESFERLEAELLSGKRSVRATTELLFCAA